MATKKRKLNGLGTSAEQESQVSNNNAQGPTRRSARQRSLAGLQASSGSNETPTDDSRPVSRAIGTSHPPNKKIGSVKPSPESFQAIAKQKTSLVSRSKLQPHLVNPKTQETQPPDDSSTYWLMKAEPESRIVKGVDVKFSIDDLKAQGGPEAWDGVRNYVARNHIRSMKKGDFAFFYHSNCKNPGIVGIMEIVQEATTDETAFDASHPYFDPKDSPEKAKWSVVHVKFRKKFVQTIGLAELKSFAIDKGPLSGMTTLKQTRLSVSNVTKQEWDFIISLTDTLDDA
ncbi:MAG: hypothetical protein M1814_002423 [Vezdaea aestivalis]|nr:MAG: hypothetical protein M1814_002423 [Vezdaea aestivalis]